AMVRPMVYGQPTLWGADGCRPGPQSRTVEGMGAGPGYAFMAAPMDSIRGFGNPHIIAAEFWTAGAVEGVVFPPNGFLKNGTVLIVRTEDHTIGLEILPVRCGLQANTDPIGRHHGIGEVISVLDLGHPAVFDAVTFIGPHPKKGGLARGLLNVAAIAAEQKPKVRQRGQIV